MTKQHALTPAILAALDTVRVPDHTGGEMHLLSTSPRLSGLSVEDSDHGAIVRFVLTIEPDNVAFYERVAADAKKAILSLEEIIDVRIVLTAPAKIPEKQHKPRMIIGVASGKGGVGKSTTALNLAIALSQRGLKVGLLDADIYGPSLPRLVGCKTKPQVDENKKILPIEAFGLRLMSMGFMVDEDVPIAWRGPMIHGALKQLIHDVVWGPLDVLLIDMPPGTGDVHLSLGNELDFTGILVVSTPQDIALIDARKSIALFERLNIPILGLIENMSGFICPHCQTRTDIFGHGGAAAHAENKDIPFLGEIPLTLALRETSDAGTPITHAQPESPEAGRYRDLAEKVCMRGIE